ncbi:MAG: DNA/RNA non-specific endonuclease, partial [Porphyromonas sp.]|nr:DNA/RNA non-specific endonuclease [Porphyromonas sp.]
NIKDQSDLSKIDLLYSDNVRGLTNTNATARLVFDHMLSQLQITVKTEGAGIDLGGLTVKLSGVLTDGVFDLAEGAVTSVGTTANEVTMFATSNSTNSAVRTAMLLPGQEIKNLQYTFEIGGDSYTYQEETSRLMQPGTKEKRTFEIHSNGVKLLDATIDIWEKGDENTVPGEEVPEQPDPLPTPDEFSNSAYYMEQVLIGKGEMEDVYIQQHNAPDSYFKSGTTPGGSRRNYTIYYSKENRLPYMVSYPMYYDCVGSVDRTNAWAYDPEIPRQYQMNLTKAYISGYSRGHMLASNNRRATEALNETTFYFTNMIPQNGNQNSGIWQQLEGRENDWAKNALKTDTMYVVCGPTLMPGAGTVRDVDGKTCPIPSHTWKVLLKKKGGQWISIAAKMPNVAPPKGAKWFDYTCTVADIERELGVKFFPFLSEEESKTVKSMNNSDDW